MKTKTSQAQELFSAGDLVGALRIAKTFRNVGKEDKNNITDAYECLVHPNFYSFRGEEWIKQRIESGKSSLLKVIF